MKSLKLFIAGSSMMLSVISYGQIYLADNGLTASGTGTTKKVSLGGTLLNAQTLIDFGSANTSSNLIVKKGTANHFFISNTGQIGIGNAAPTQVLDVTGTIKSTGLIVTVGTPAVGKFLTSTDANGTVTWTSTLPIANGGTGAATVLSNLIFAGPISGAAAAPAFRALVTNDIPNSVITYAKVQNVTGLRLLGNSGATAGVVGEISIGSGLSLSGGVLSATGGGAGTVTNFIFTNQNGFIGTVNTSATTPTLSLSTSLNGLLRGNGTAFVTGSANLATEVTGTLAITNGGTGQTSFGTGYLKSNGTSLSSSAIVAGSEISGNITGNAANVTGTVAILNGGTGATTQNTALNNLLPVQASNAGKVLQTNGTIASWATVASGISQWTTTVNDISNNNTGNVGIGTVSPNNKLHVAGDIAIDAGLLKFVNNWTGGSLVAQGSFGTTAIGGLQIRAKSGSSFDFGFFDPAGNTYLLANAGSNSLFFGDHIMLNPTKKIYLDGGSDTYISEVTSNNIGFVTGGTERVRINESGNVSIGAATIPIGYKLAVGGNIIAEKVRVKLQSAGWPDYVFNENYTLPSLKETEQFIKENKHLPGIPSAEEVGKNGIDLGDNQALLLKKVEELTLYIIELNKKSEEQNKKISELEKQDKGLKELRRQMEELKKLFQK